MEIIGGKIVVYDENGDEECSYEIEQITAEFEEDIHDVIGVVRCTGITYRKWCTLRNQLRGRRQTL